MRCWIRSSPVSVSDTSSAMASNTIAPYRMPAWAPCSGRNANATASYSAKPISTTSSMPPIRGNNSLFYNGQAEPAPLLQALGVQSSCKISSPIPLLLALLQNSFTYTQIQLYHWLLQLSNRCPLSTTRCSNAPLPPDATDSIAILSPQQVSSHEPSQSAKKQTLS